MVSLTAIRHANGSLPSTSPIVVFVGSTSGIGLGTIEALLQHTDAPRVIIVGRSRSKFSSTLSRLQKLNGKATLTFVEAQVSCLKEVDRACSIITSEHSTIDLLWLSQGGLAQATGTLSSEGLNEDLAISYYSRAFFMHRLLPQLSASYDPRILSVLSAGQEGALNISDLGLLNSRDFGTFPTMKHNVTLMSLVMRELALQSPKVSFIHTNPGMVSTAVHDRWLNGLTGVWAVFGWLAKWTIVPFFHWLGFTPEEAGQVGLYELTDARYASRSRTNFFRLDEKAEVLPAHPTLKGYEEDGSGCKAWEHTLRVYENVVWNGGT